MTTFDSFDANLRNGAPRSNNFLLGNEMDVGSQIPHDVVYAIAEYLGNSGGRIVSDYDYNEDCSSEMREALDR